jgi:hypothetical protein
MSKHSTSILELAKKGATHRYQELKSELAELVKAFPHLEFGSAISPAAPKQEFERLRNAGKRRKVSAAGRKRISDAQKKRWAARSKAAK